MTTHSLALYSRVQGRDIRLCSVNPSFFTTRKREAQQAAVRYNRKHGHSPASGKWCGVESATL